MPHCISRQSENPARPGRSIAQDRECLAAVRLFRFREKPFQRDARVDDQAHRVSRPSRISSSAVRKVAPGLRAASTPRQHDRRYCELSPVPQRSSDGYDCIMISLCSGRDLTRLSQQIFAGSTRECAGGRDIANRPRGMFRPDPRLGAGLAASAATNSSSPRIATSAPTPSGSRRAKSASSSFSGLL